MRYAAALLALLACPASAQPSPRLFEGAWNWDPFQSELPPWLSGDPHVVAETMLVAHDDGTRYAARIDQVFSNGGRKVINEDFAEDGREHAVASTTGPFMARIQVMADGSRHMVLRWGREVHDVRCDLSANAMTLTCAGIHLGLDGSVGDVICVFHRDPYRIPVSALPPRTRMG